MTQRREPGFGPDVRQARAEFDAEDHVRPSAGRPRRRLPLSVVALGLLLLGGVVYALVGNVGQTHVTESGIPVILADPTPVRVRPEQPGGMQIPFQDTTVYDEIASGKKASGSGTEHLLATAEQPLPKPEAPAAKPDVAPAAGDQPKPAAADAATPPPAAENDAVLAPQPVPAPAVTPAAPAMLLPPPPAKHAATPKPAKVQPDSDDTDDDDDADDQPARAAAPARPSPGGAGHSEIQLGAFKDASVAETEWQKMLAAQGEELGSLTHRIERADLGPKGIWYRLKAGPLDDAHARSVCMTLKSQGLTCFVAGK